MLRDGTKNGCVGDYPDPKVAGKRSRGSSYHYKPLLRLLYISIHLLYFVFPNLDLKPLFLVIKVNVGKVYWDEILRIVAGPTSEELTSEMSDSKNARFCRYN